MCYDRRSNLKGTQVFMSEDLSKQDAKLFYLARQLKKNKVIFDTWTRGNRIFVKKYRLHNSVQINSEKELDEMVLQIQNQSIPPTERKSSSEEESDSNDADDEEHNEM